MMVHLIAAALLLASQPATPAPSANPAPSKTDAAVLAEVRGADAAFVAAQSRNDLAAMAAMMADDYAYIDVSGVRADKAKVLSRREGDKLSLSEMVDSEDEALILSPTVVLLRGKSAGTALYFGGLPRTGATRWSAIWRKDADRRWRVVAEQTTVVIGSLPKKVRAVLTPAQVASHAGTWRLATKAPLTMTLHADGDVLEASIAGQFTDMVFEPERAGVFFNSARPFELRFDPDGRTLRLLTWVEETVGTRIGE